MGFFRKEAVPAVSEASVPSSVAQAIEDAVLFGHVKEIDAVLDLVEDNDDFPQELLYALQALRYFREHYGQDGDMPPGTPLQQQKVTVIEAAWGAEILDLLHHKQEAVAKRA